MKKQLINGKVYDWSSVTINVDGMESIEPTEISYGDEQELELIYRSGGKPAGYGTGNQKNAVSLTLLREDYDEMVRVIRKKGYKSFYKYMIPKIIVSYADEGAPTSTDVITNVKFSKRDLKTAQGEKKVEVKLDGLAVGGVKTNGLGA